MSRNYYEDYSEILMLAVDEEIEHYEALLAEAMDSDDEAKTQDCIAIKVALKELKEKMERRLKICRQ